MRARRARAISVLTLLVYAAACGGSPPAPTPAPTQPGTTTATVGEAYLRGLIAVMRTNSVNRLRIDWNDFQAQVLAKGAGAATIPATYPAISLALGLLNDHHSFYQAANNAGGIGNPNFPPGCSIAAVDDPPVPADIGYVRIGAFSGAGQQEFAASIQAAIRARDTGGLAGWIVDLRGNGGGNMWPMLAGVGPVLGLGTAGYFVVPEGSPQPWFYRVGASVLGGTVMVSVPTPYELRRSDPRVAVLTDKRVASSGEAIAVAFRGRPNTRTFGTDTCGVPTANDSYTLGDGAVLVLTTAVDADRTHLSYDSPLAPDETITDPTVLVQRAIAWLRSGS